MFNKKIASLIIKAKEGDESAYAELYKELWNPLYYYARRRLNSSEDAKDAVQDTMIELNNNLRTLKNDVAFEAWINKILSRKCAYICRMSNKVEVLDIDEMSDFIEEEYIEFIPEEVLSQQETCKQIAEVVSVLPEEQREAVLLYYFQRFSTSEISETMEISPNAVKQKLAKARKTIRDKVEVLQKQGFVIGVTPGIPVLTRIFMEDMKNICTPEIGVEICANVQTALAAGVTATVGIAGTTLTSGATTTGIYAAPIGAAAAKTASLSTALVLKISASVLTISIIGGGVALYVNSQDAPPSPSIAAMETVTPTATPTPTPTPTPTAALTAALTPAPTSTPTSTPAPTVKPVETLDDFVGKEDADIIRSWAETSNANNNEAFIQMIEKHGLALHSVFVDVENNGDMYTIFTKDIQDKRLLMCEYYNSGTDMWAAVYSVQSIEAPVPQTYEINSWFKETQANLLLSVTE